MKARIEISFTDMCEIIREHFADIILRQPNTIEKDVNGNLLLIIDDRKEAKK